MYIKRLAIILILLFIGIIPSYAQSSTAPDYKIWVVSLPELSGDNANFSIKFGLLNVGIDATTSATVQIYPLTDVNQLITQTTVTPLRRNEVREVTMSFPVRTLPAGQQVPLGVRVLLAEEASNTLLDNNASFSVSVPLYEGEQVAPVVDETSIPTEQAPTLLPEGVIRIPIINVDVDLNNGEQRAMFAGVLGGICLLILILMLIARVLFRKVPLFGSYKPPYSTTSQYDRNSTIGRRQLWQQHAQNNSVQYPCRQGTYHARKLLLGTNGQYLDGWRITAFRMMQYDMYGRITRSQVLATQRWVKRLNKIAHKGGRLKPKQISRRVLPIAKWMNKQFKKRLSPKTGLLSIALDVRFEGRHGEVRIVFELHDCHQGMPALLDQWDPDMVIMGRTLHESYTYTISGQNNTETYRQFKKRLRGDIQQSLAELCQVITVAYPEPIMSAPNFLNPPTHPTSSPPTERGMPAVSLKTPTAPVTERVIVEVPTEHNIFSATPPPPSLEGLSDETQQHTPNDDDWQ